MIVGLRALARAKLTLSLRVLGRRDDGFHDLEAFTISLAEPHDVVTLRVRDAFGVALSMSGRAATGLPGGTDNLAVRAARALLEEPADPAALGPFAAAGLELILHKTIPAGAGLGGGSADAAAVLVGGNRLLDLGFAPERLAALGARLGSDVPFCLTGGAAWMHGRGEELTPLDPVERFSLVVAVPPFGLSTPAVYRAWDELGGPQATRGCPIPPELARLGPDGARSSAAPGSAGMAAAASPDSRLMNDLEPAAEAVEPRLAPYRRALEDLAGYPALLAGSGSAYAIPVPNGDAAIRLADEIPARLGGVAFASRPIDQGVTIQGT